MPQAYRLVVPFASFAFAVVLLAATAGTPAPAVAADAFYSPTVTGIDTACNAARAKARPADIVRLARFAAAGQTLGDWMPARSADLSRLQAQSDFATGEIASIVFENGAIVSADVSHSDVAAGTVLSHAWCFIGGKLSRATADVANIVTRVGYRRTRYYGDDLSAPLDELMQDTGFQGKAYRAPPKDVDAILVTDPIARPADLPFYAAAAAARSQRSAR